MQIIKDIQRCNCLGYAWDGNEYKKKGIHPIKNKFVAKRKICSKHDGEFEF